MSNIDVKIVIGSNYGDEGKGMATHYFSQQAFDKNKKCLNILFNGGCQRGHTVEMKNGIRHIFHHFGSGTLDAAHTYFDKDFMINPIFFNNEYAKLYNSERITPICFISPDCRVSTPYDMLINQIVERIRKNNKHGSCGFGIFETQQRYKNSKYNLTYSELINKTDIELRQYFKDIALVYLPYRLKEYGICDIPKDIQNIINSECMIHNFINDLRSMSLVVQQIDFPELIKYYDVVVFEGAQGLELDEDNIDGMPHLTASKTTAQIPLKRLQLIHNINVEVCYVTRSYFTRHGAGILPSECSKDLINPCIIDQTNVDNEFQDSIRYGLFVKEEFLNRICKDIDNSCKLMNNILFSIFITHLNYTKNNLSGDCKIDDITHMFNKKYLSSSKYIEDVQMEEI